MIGYCCNCDTVRIFHLTFKCSPYNEEQKKMPLARLWRNQGKFHDCIRNEVLTICGTWKLSNFLKWDENICIFFFVFLGNPHHSFLVIDFPTKWKSTKTLWIEWINEWKSNKIIKYSKSELMHIREIQIAYNDMTYLVVTLPPFCISKKYIDIYGTCMLQCHAHSIVENAGVFFFFISTVSSAFTIYKTYILFEWDTACFGLPEIFIRWTNVLV